MIHSPEYLQRLRIEMAAVNDGRPLLPDDLAFYAIGISPDSLMNGLGEPMWKQFLLGIICHRYLNINHSITQSLDTNSHQTP